MILKLQVSRNQHFESQNKNEKKKLHTQDKLNCYL